MGSALEDVAVVELTVMMGLISDKRFSLELYSKGWIFDGGLFVGLFVETLVGVELKGLAVMGSALDVIAVVGLAVGMIMLELISDEGLFVGLFVETSVGVELEDGSNGLAVRGSALDGIAVVGLAVGMIMLELISDDGLFVGLFVETSVGVELEDGSNGLAVRGSALDGIAVVGLAVRMIMLGLASVGLELEGFSLGSAVGLLRGIKNG